MHLDINRVGVTQIFNVMKKIKIRKRTVANLSASEMMGVHGASVAEGDCMGSYNCSERVCVSNDCPTGGCLPNPERTDLVCTLSCPGTEVDCATKITCQEITNATCRCL